MTFPVRSTLGVFALALCAWAASAPTSAQTLSNCIAPAGAGSEASAPSPRRAFGGLLKSIGGAVAAAASQGGSLEAAVQKVGSRAAEHTASSAIDCSKQAAAGIAGATGAAGARSGPTVVSAGRKPVDDIAPTYTKDIPKPADFNARRDAYMAFGRDDCNDCEGGYAYDGWAVFPRDAYTSKYNGKAQRIGNWPVGHVHRWAGNVSTGTLTVVAETTVSGFRCRTLLYRLTKRGAIAELPGLLCWGRDSQFAGSESWHEVY